MKIIINYILLLCFLFPIMSTSKLILLTGSTGSIGKSIAIGLAKDKSNLVLLPIRSLSKGKECLNEIIKESGDNNNVIPLELNDVGSARDVQALAKYIDETYGYLDVLINNAAFVNDKLEYTKDGIESMFSTNVIGYYNTITYFKGLLSKSNAKPARVVNVASNYAGGLTRIDEDFVNVKGRGKKRKKR